MQSYMTYNPEEETRPKTSFEADLNTQLLKEYSIVYMVAGISSRFGGEIKQFAKIGPNNETLIEYSLNQAIKAGFNKIIFIVGEKTILPFKEMFGNRYNGVPIEYTFQEFDKEKRDRPWGTSDAVCTILPIINGPFVVCNGDDIYGQETFQTLLNHLKTNQTDATAGFTLIKTLPETGKVHRAIFTLDNQNNVTNLKEGFNLEKQTLHLSDVNPDDLCSMNIFALQPETLEKLNTSLKEFKQINAESRTAECLLPDEIGKLIRSNQMKLRIYPTNAKWYGVTNPGDEIVVRNQLIQEHL